MRVVDARQPHRVASTLLGHQAWLLAAISWGFYGFLMDLGGFGWVLWPAGGGDTRLCHANVGRDLVAGPAAALAGVGLCRGDLTWLSAKKI